MMEQAEYLQEQLDAYKGEILLLWKPSPMATNHIHNSGFRRTVLQITVVILLLSNTYIVALISPTVVVVFFPLEEV